MASPIELIATDLDGTLLNRRHEFSPRNEAALKRAIAQGVQVVLATGKTRYSAAEVIRRLGLTTPGVFVQGLIVCDANGVIQHETSLTRELATEVADFAAAEGLALVTYSGHRILTPERSAFTDQLIRYHEPEPEDLGSWQAVQDEGTIHKILLIDDATRIRDVRARLSDQLGNRATLVQALPDMLEVLPTGASKGAGLKRLLQDADVPFERILAIGDGENDVEMLTWAGIGVAVGNAVPAAKAAADYVVGSNDEDGVAEAIERFVLRG